MRKIKVLSLALLMAVICAPALAQQAKDAQKPEGFAVITSIQGTAEVKAGKKEWTAAKPGMLVNQGETIRTKAGAWVQLDFYEGKKKRIASVEIKQNSQLRIAQLKPRQGILLDLALGEALVNAEKLNSGKAKFEVKTPTSFVEVVGKAEFSVAVEKLEQ